MHENCWLCVSTYEEKLIPNKESNADVIDRYTRKATSGKYRVLGYDQYDHNDYFIAECEQLELAIAFLREKASIANGTPTSFSDIYYIYNDREEALYKATFDDGVERV